MLGQIERANDEWAEAYRIAAELEADRELCIGAFLEGFGLLGFDLEAGLRWTSESIERSRALGFTWAEGFASTLDGILHAVAGDLDTAQTRYSAGARDPAANRRRGRSRPVARRPRRTGVRSR